MYARTFLIVGGAVLLLLGLVGYAGIFSKENTPWFWLDDGENLAHTFLGVVALAAVYVPGLNSALRPYYRAIVALVGVIALFFAGYGFLQASGADPNTFGVSNLENPSDNLLHLVVGIVALAAAWIGSPDQGTAAAWAAARAWGCVARAADTPDRLATVSPLIVGHVAGPVAPSAMAVAIAGRWLLLAGLCLMVGAAFVATVIYPAPRRSLLLLSAAAWLAAVVGIGFVLLTLVGVELDVPLWRVAVLRSAPLLVAGIAIAAERRTAQPSTRGMATIGIAAAAAMLADVGTTHLSHTEGAHPEHVQVFVHWLHVVGVGTWVGGLAALLVSVPREGGAAVASVVRRFSVSAGIGIGVVSVTGLVRAVQELGPLDNLLTTDFGRLLVAKTVLLVALAALGAGQRLVSVPAATRWLGPLRRIGGAELAVGAVVLLLASALVNVPPPG